MRLEHLTVEEAYAALRSGPGGLTSGEAARRFSEFGPNHVERVRREPLARRALRQFTHFFALILLVAAMLAFVAERTAPGSGMGTLAWAILAVLGVNGAFSFWQEYRADQAMAALAKLLPRAVHAVRDGIVAVIDARNVVPGDVLALEDGDRVPADARVVECFGLRIDASTLTGESLPIPRTTQASQPADPAHSRNLVMAGTAVVAGRGLALVYATGSATEFAKLARLTQSGQAPLSPLQREIVRVSRIIAALSIALGVVFFSVGALVHLSLWTSLLFGVGILVANVPEGLLPQVTLTLAMASRRMAARNALVRHLPSVEAVGSATVICTDKTGTLTQNRMAVRGLFVGERLYDARDDASLRTLGRSHRALFECAAACHDLHRTRDRLLGDPMEMALVELSAQALKCRVDTPRIDEIPFDSDRRRVSVLHLTDDGPTLYTKGAPEVVLVLSTHVKLDSAIEPLTDAHRARIVAAVAALASDGLRVLALAYRPLPENTPRDRFEQDLILLGIVALHDPPRPEVADAVARCKAAGIRVIMVTGDHPLTACAIAREVGLAKDPHAITGEQLRSMSDAQLQLELDGCEILFARTDADQKTRIVHALKRKGEIVAVTGDGVNDAPALKAADAGIAMGRSGTDVARETADIVLADDNFASIVNAVEEGRAVFANIRKFLAYVLASNVAELVPYLAFVLVRIPLPLTILQMLVVDLGTDVLPALALGAEPPDARVMRNPPRARGERLIDTPLLLRAYLLLGVLEALGAMATYFFVLRTGSWRFGEELAEGTMLYRKATTACLTAIVVAQVVNVFLCRSERASVFDRIRNRLLWVAIGIEILLIVAVDYLPWGNRVFSTAPISVSTWLFALPFAGLMLLADELHKLWLRRTAAPTAASASSLNSDDAPSTDRASCQTCD